MPIIELPYQPDGLYYLEKLRGVPGCACIDSAAQGRFDIVSAAPDTTLSTFGALTRIRRKGQTSWSFADPLTLLGENLAELSDEPCELPFCGGAIGYFGYELGHRYEPRVAEEKPGQGFPDMHVGIHAWAVVLDHSDERAWLTGHCPDDIAWRLRQRQAPDAGQHVAFSPASLQSPDRENYARAFYRIQDYIADGDCYQVNLTRPFRADCVGDSVAAYRRLRANSPAPRSAFLKTPYGDILSVSPERFLDVHGRHILTSPIKGTCKRSGDAASDQRLAEALRNSSKDQAENIMIVDLLRNDLGRVCEPGSVQVESLLDVEKYATVQHLVSTISGHLDGTTSVLDALRDCLPGGSITGAPKIRAMEIINELETQRREVYCGAIGYVNAQGDMQTSIAIRTMTIRNNAAIYRAGGGIVADSTLVEEYEEMFDKAAPFLRTVTEPSRTR